MNSVANGKIRERTPFDEVYIQPAAGDNGTALGAAFYVWHQMLGGSRAVRDGARLLGPVVRRRPHRRGASTRGATISRASAVRCARSTSETRSCDWTAARIAGGHVVGWFQGRMEWGARALGNRSILADPRRADMREIINTKIKFREKFRPFAPSMLEEALRRVLRGRGRRPVHAAGLSGARRQARR